MISLVVTIIVLLILAGTSIIMFTGENGIINKAQQATIANKIAQAREKLELTFEHAQILKYTEQKYNQDDYLDNLMKSEISNIKIKGDIVIVDDLAFEIDRSVPKIGQYLGKENDLIFPEITTTVSLATDSKTATIQIKAKEEINGISKIEVIKGSQVLKQYNYENKKELITENYIAKYNGIYKIKVYSNLTVSEKVEIESLISSVTYSPIGNNEYKKEHQVKVCIEDESDGIKSLKYQWSQMTEEPETFINLCNNNEIITGNNFNGTYYLWTLLETQSGKINICRSEEFNFDNQGPTVILTSIPVSESSFILNATADDEYSEIAK